MEQVQCDQGSSWSMIVNVTNAFALAKKHQNVSLLSTSTTATSYISAKVAPIRCPHSTNTFSLSRSLPTTHYHPGLTNCIKTVEMTYWPVSGCPDDAYTPSSLMHDHHAPCRLGSQQASCQLNRWRRICRWVSMASSIAVGNAHARAAVRMAYPVDIRASPTTHVTRAAQK